MKHQKNSHTKSLQSKIMLGVMIIFIGILSISLVSAWDMTINNVKDYDAITKTVTISDSYLVTKTEIAKVQLLTPIVNVVTAGKNRLVAEFKVTNQDDYNSFLKSMELYNVNDKNKAIEKNLNYKVKKVSEIEIDDFYYKCNDALNKTSGKIENMCNKIVNGTMKQENIEWIDMANMDLLKGEYTIGIFTDVALGEKVEWIPEMFGVRIDEWATWIGGSSAHGINLISAGNDVGKLGVVIRVKDNITITNITTVAAATDNAAYIYSIKSGTGYMIANALLQQTTITSNVGNFSYNLTAGKEYLIASSTGGSRVSYLNMTFSTMPVATPHFNYTNGTLESGGIQYVCGACGGLYLGQILNIGWEYLDDSAAPATPIAITANLIAPTNNTLTKNQTICHTSNATATNANLTNATYFQWAWGVLNYTTNYDLNNSFNTTSTCVSQHSTANYTWNVRYCGTNATDYSCVWGANGNYSYEVDNTNPTIAWKSPSTVYTGNVSCMINMTIADTNRDTAYVKVWNTSGYYTPTTMVNETLVTGGVTEAEFNISNLGDGVFIYNGYANDTLNNTASLISPNNAWCFIDTQTPQTSISGSNGSQTSKNIVVNVLTNDYNSRMGVVTNLSLYNSTHDLINNTINSTIASTTLGYTFLNLADGLYYYNATATDIGGNVNYTDTINVTIDTAAPTVAITAPLAENYTVVKTEIDYTVSDTNIDSCTIGNESTNFTTDCAGTVNDTALTSHEGSNTWYLWANDSAGNSNQTSVTFFVDSIAPSVDYTSNSTADGSIVRLPFLLEGYATDANNMKNTSLMFGSSPLNWGICSGPVSWCLNTQYVIPIVDRNDGYYEYNFTFCDVYGNCNTTTTRNVTISTVDYNATTIETSHESFTWHYFDTTPVFSLAGSLFYNNTAYPITYNCSDYNFLNISTFTQCEITSSFDIPLISSAGPEVNSFYFNITVFNGFISYNENSMMNNQSVEKLAATYCTNGTISLNFTAWDEQNQSKIEPFKFEGTINYYLGSGGAFRTLELNIVDPATTEVNVCINQNTSYYIDAIIAYSAPASGLAYPTRNWFYQRHQMNNATTEHIPMYLLQGAASTQFILQVQDENLLPVKGVLIEAQKCYVGNDTTPIAFISRTDTNGLTTGNFEVYNALYQFRITNYSNTLLQVLPCSKVIPQTVPYTLLFQLGTGYVSPFTDITNATAITSSLTFNKSSGQTIFSYTDTSGNFNASELIITSMNYSGNLQPVMCNVIDTSLSSGILNCTITRAGTYSAMAYIYRGGEILYDQIVFTVETFSSTVGYYGVFIAFFLLLVSAFAFKFNEIAGIWLMVIGCIFCNVVGLIAFGAVGITALICVAITITVVLER